MPLTYSCINTVLNLNGTVRISCGILHNTCRYSRTQIIRKLVIRTANYPDRLGPSAEVVENCTKLTCFEISCYRIKYSTVLWLLEFQIRRGRKVSTQVHTINSNSRTSNCQCGLLSKKIIRIFYKSRWLAVQLIRYVGFYCIMIVKLSLCLIIHCVIKLHWVEYGSEYLNVGLTRSWTVNARPSRFNLLWTPPY